MTTEATPRPDDAVLLPLVHVLGEIATRVAREQATTKDQTPRTNAA